VRAPHTTKFRKFTIDGGTAFRLRSTPFCGEGSSRGAMALVFIVSVIKKAHNDKPRQVRKRKVKLNRWIRNIPREGVRAKEILGARKK
jgi:hypothetical protein